MKRFVNPFARPGKWYKADLHMHTTLSDGGMRRYSDEGKTIRSFAANVPSHWPYVRAVVTDARQVRLDRPDFVVTCVLATRGGAVR